MVQIVESTIGRRYGGWFIRNTEHALKVYDTIKSSPLPISKNAAAAAPAESAATGPAAGAGAAKTGGAGAGNKPVWGAPKTVRLAA
jgi:translation initiation factor 3 subunit L